MGLNPSGRRGLTKKDKEKLKKEYKKKTGKKTPSKLLEIDHKKPRALYEKKWWEDKHFGELQQLTKTGRPKKQPHDRKSNLQALHRKTHRKKTKEDMKKIKKNRKKRMKKLGIGYEIIGKTPKFNF